MKRLSYLALGVLSFSLFNGALADDKIVVNVAIESPKKAYAAYIKSLLVSGTIGVVTGAATAYIEKKLGAMPGELLSLLIWNLEWNTRLEIFRDLRKAADTNDVANEGGGMWLTGRLASWVAYVAMYAK